MDGTEAFELMTTGGAVLEAAGFTVRVPQLAKKRSTPRLQLHAEAFGGESVVGAQQLSRVQWSVAVDDVSLDAAVIRKLALQARPLVKTKGGWVELDKADLEAAAEALAARSKRTEMSGAEILRHAVGLESGTGGPVIVDGAGWAVDLVHGAAAGAARPLPAPEGFDGELRHYQAEARGWLGFLDRAGLGGCLAMDMGLGKTPTVLAHLLEHKDEGPSLVIAPPAVLATGRRRRPGSPPVSPCRSTTAPTGPPAKTWPRRPPRPTSCSPPTPPRVRDVEELAKVDWARLIIDEAQAIKNPASDTAQELRRIPARSRLALTGTPVENGLGDLWSILDFTNPGLVGPRPVFIEALSRPRPIAARGRRWDAECDRSGQVGGAGAAGPQRAAGLPPHQVGAGDRRRAARQDRRARPLRHDPRAGRAVPGGPRQPPGLHRPSTATRTPPPGRVTSWPPSPTSSRSATTRPPTSAKTTTDRWTGAPASWPGSRS